jgi:hypothetical protein
MGAITELHFVHNYSSSAVTINNLENSFTLTCPAATSTFISYQWVPWCSKGSDFPTHHIVITVSGVMFNTWQDTDTDGNWVRLSTSALFISSANPPFTPAPRFPGAAMDGGDRDIVVAPGGALSLLTHTT